MFYVDDWLPLLEVTKEFFRWHQCHYEKVPFPGFSASEGDLNAYRDACAVAAENSQWDAAAAVWECLHTAPKVGVLCANGKVVRASHLLIDVSDFVTIGEHIDIWVGTVGSANWRNDEGQVSSDLEKAKFYGPFLHCPILVPERHVMDFFHALQQSDRENAQPVERDLRALPQRIADLFDADPGIRKPEIRRKLCPGLKVAAFETIYQEAAKLRPDLNRRGPKRNGGARRTSAIEYPN